MNPEHINKLLDSSFEYSSFDDTDDDPNLETNNVQNVEDALSGNYGNYENDDSNFNTVSHVSGSPCNSITSTVRGPGRPSNQPNTNTHQWRDDDNVIENFVYNSNSTNTGINPDILDTMIDATPI